MEQLACLQDNITPFDSGVARRVIEADLGQPISTVFSEFSERPIAAASLAQVWPELAMGTSPGTEDNFE